MDAISHFSQVRRLIACALFGLFLVALHADARLIRAGGRNTDDPTGDDDLIGLAVVASPE